MLSKWWSTPEMIDRMLSFEIITPFGSPVVPLVYIIVQISVFFFIGMSYFLLFPCRETRRITITHLFGNQVKSLLGQEELYQKQKFTPRIYIRAKISSNLPLFLSHLSKAYNNCRILWVSGDVSCKNHTRTIRRKTYFSCIFRSWEMFSTAAVLMVENGHCHKEKI